MSVRRFFARRSLATLCWLWVAGASHAAWAEPARWQQEGWTKTDFNKSRISWQEIASGGPPKDGIPSIDRPIFKSVTEDQELIAGDPVIGLAIGDDARAYPLRILIWHEIVNDTVGGVPVTVTYCPLCNSVVVFDRRVPPHTLVLTRTCKLSVRLDKVRTSSACWPGSATSAGYRRIHQKGSAI